MYTARQAREAVTKYEDDVRQKTLENLLKKENNREALKAFEETICNLAETGNTMLFISQVYSKELYEYAQHTDIITILKFLDYSISTDYNYYEIKW